MNTDASVARVREFFETLSPATIARLPELYTADAYFKDPFNEVRGVAAIQRIFEHMYVQVQAPRFVVTEAIGQGEVAFLSWEFRFHNPRMGPGEQTIRGATRLGFAPDGRVDHHRDYWDAAEELYAKLPLIGRLMRWLQKRAAS